MSEKRQPSASEQPSAAGGMEGRRGRRAAQEQEVRDRLRALFSRLLGTNPKETDERASFLELGADSLLLLQASQNIRDEFGINIPFRDLLEKLPTLEILGTRLAHSMPGAADPLEGGNGTPAEWEFHPEPFPPTREPEAPAEQHDPGAGWAEAGPANGSNNEPQALLQEVLNRQLDILDRHFQLASDQLELLSGIASGEKWGPADSSRAARSSLQPAAQPAAPPPLHRPAAPAARSASADRTAAKGATADRQAKQFDPGPYLPYQPARSTPGGLTPQQQGHLEDLAQRLQARNRKSKRLAQQSRRCLADNRASTGFRLLYKELLYPIFARRASGSRVWDIDGNEYVDLVMGFGTLVFGHSPPFLRKALQRQNRRGLQIGLESPSAARAAELICRMTGNERAAFLNSGTEAVMAAIRLARLKTGRTRIAMFQGGYHGFFDETLVISAASRDGSLRSMPMAPGVSPHVSENVLVLKYCSRQSIQTLKSCAHQLAAVLVEPQQARRPGIDTRKFLQELREVTSQRGTALILDEVVTGFRMHPGGAQAVFGIRADIVTYGKAVGAGIPVGVVSGKAEYLDGLDGGWWNYGDDSYPQAESTFLAGTYFKHPLTMAAVCAVLEQYAEQGPQLQQRLSERTAQLAERLNRHFEQRQLPIRLKHWGSMSYLTFAPEVKHSSLIYYHLLENGLYVRDGRPWFLSTAHTAEDIDQIVQAVRAATKALQEGGFLPGSGPTGPANRLHSPASTPPEAAPPDLGRVAAAPAEAERQRLVAASPAQRELWLLAQLGEGACRAYNESLKLRLCGPLRLKALAQAIQQVSDRHEALRAAFDPQGEALRIAPRQTVDFALHELSHLDETERQARLALLLQREANRVFDLCNGPLLRVGLIRLGRRRHVLAWTVHHSIADGLSNSLIIREAAALYSAASRGQDARLPEPIAFSEFVRRQKQWQAGPEMDHAEAFWLKEFARRVEPLRLPSDRPRMSQRTFNGAWQTRRIGSAVHQAVKEAARAGSSTLFAFLAAAVQVFLHRLSGQNDLVLGTAAAGQAEMGASCLVGHCVNLLPVRSSIGSSTRFSEQLAIVRRKLLDIHEHQNYPFSTLVRKLKLPSDPARAPLLSAVMNLDQGASVAPAFFGLEAEVSRNPVKGAKFDFFLDLKADAQGLEIPCNYNADLFDGTTIQRWLSHLETLLEAIARNPQSRLLELPLLRKSEFHQVLTEHNDTPAKPYRPQCLHELFEAQAAGAPDAVALFWEEAGRGSVSAPSPAACHCSYGQLDTWADRLARVLIGQGVQTETAIGICTNRSSLLIVGLLAILKAGGTYLPLEPATPKRRLAFMLEDVQARLLLTCRSLRRRLPAPLPSLLWLDGQWPDAPPRQPALMRPRTQPENLAYVIYTSGSTGKPKGVEISHAGLANLLAWHRGRFGLGAKARTTQLASLGFDASALETWPALTSGATLCMVADHLRLSAPDLLNWIAAVGIDGCFMPTQLAEAVMQAEACSGKVPLKALLTGGDRLHRSALKATSFPLFNLYGPTENSICASWHRVSGGASDPPIGRPLSNVQLYVLSSALQPAPGGVAGELHIGGSGLARGYARRPALTAERFIPHPFSRGPGERLYKTGDLVRMRADGEAEFLGRIDHQVKVRGFRIELGEIEAVLGRHPAVREAVAVLRPAAAGDTRLVAYVAAASSQPGLMGDLRSYLRRRLPDYMTPSLFVLLERLPLTPSGKVNRQALPPPERAQHDPGKAYAAPRTGLEKCIAEVWREILGVEKVGLGDNFFDLGGHSLLMARLRENLRRALNADLSILDLFQFPTIQALSRHLRTRDEAMRWERAPEAANGRAAPTSATAAAGQARAGASAGSIAIIGMAGRFPGAADIDAFWENLCEGRESISFFSAEELHASGVPVEHLDDPDYVRAAAVLQGSDLFDASFFGISPREAQLMNPQHRVFLECAWEALENAGYAADAAGRVGVYGGAGTNAYVQRLLADPETSRAAGEHMALIGNGNDHLTARVSYKLNLKGPSCNVQTACSTSLTAVHLACQSLLDRHCDMALAGGVTIGVPQKTGYFVQGRPLSPDGHCRAFDAGARGTVFGSGCAIVVLKRLGEAMDDGDTIYAVIRGSAINNDGSDKVGYAAPSVHGQADVISRALQAAAVDPSTIRYVEAHGTATPMGDPMEVAALTQAFRAAGTDRKGFCAIGSVKTNVGHLDAAAGTAGLIKTVLALKNHRLPPSLNFKEPNPEIDFPNSPFYVNTRLQEWTSNNGPLRAGVSSFGVGGTNAHVVLEEPPAPPETEPQGAAGPWSLLLLSAKSSSALEKAAENLSSHLRKHPQINLADVACTLQAGRQGFEHGLFLVCRSAAQAEQALKSLDPKQVVTARRPSGEGRCAFLFPGLGHHHAGMGQGLYRHVRAFRRHVDECAALLKPLLELDLGSLLDPPSNRSQEAARLLERLDVAHAAQFSVEYALGKTWMEWGIEPLAMIGHSLGEYAAACLAGVFSPADALGLMVLRGRLIEKSPPGAMLSVSLAEGELKPLLGPELSLALVNGPSSCVVSGRREAVRSLEAHLSGKGLHCRRLHVSRAGHSHLLDGVLEPFAEELARIDMKAPRLPYLSNLSGEWVTPAQVAEPDYWVRHLRSTVLFSQGLERLLEDYPQSALLEVGPGNALGTLVRQHPKASGRAVVSSMRHPQETEPDAAFLLKALGRLWLAGVEMNWQAHHQGMRRQRLPLPTYPFDRKRFWVDAQAGAAPSASVYKPAQQPIFEEIPAADQAPAEQPLGFAGPRNRIEQQVAAVWKHVLGIGQIGIYENFFELGGHSLIATRILSRLTKDFEVELPLASFFEDATVAGLSGKIEDALREQGRDVPSPARKPVIAPRDDSGPAPLSFAQQRLWFLDQMTPNNPVYNIDSAWKLKGPLDIAALHYSLDEIVGRHEALRTRFITRQGQPFQSAFPAAGQALPIIDLGKLDRERRAAELKHLAREEALRPFALDRGPLLRTALLRIDAEESALLITMHHIISDMWSMGVFRQELAALYGFAAARVRREVGRCPSLAPLPIQYADFAAWQREWLQGEVLEDQLGYWKGRLAGADVLELPTDRPRPRIQAFDGAYRPFRMPQALGRTLQALGRRQGATLYMTLLASLQALFHRWTGQTDILVGSPIANRNRHDTENLIGFFVNTLPMRGDLSGDPRFASLLGKTARQTLQDYAHQDVPFEKLVDHLDLERDLSRNPLFQVVFALQNAPMAPLGLSGLTISPLRSEAATTRFDLEVILWEEPQEVRGVFVYEKGLFDPTSIQRLQKHFRTLLEGIAADPGRRLSELPILSDGERSQLLHQWNDTRCPEAQGRHVHQLFDAQAEQRPDAAALNLGPGWVSYRELQVRANQLAACLGRLEVQPETIVGVCLERCLEMPSALLGVLKAGGAYLPLEPAYPARRLTYMMQDAQVPVLLTSRSLKKRLPMHPPSVLCLDSEWAGMAQERRPVPSPKCSPQMLAYVIYTSGSTGKPKGVEACHGGLNNLLRWQQAHFGLGAGARTPQLATPGFDAAVWEIWFPLTSGATLYLASDRVRRSPPELIGWFKAVQIEACFLSTQFAQAFLQDDGCSAGLALKFLFAGGERMHRSALKQIPVPLYNLYGPTENTVYTTLTRVGNDPSNPPIGRPIANVQTYVLDQALRPVPAKVAGELHISGQSLTRGYLGRPGLTAERFIPNPFGRQPGQRLYKTGDLVCWRIEGEIDFLGRLDHQVKVRGFRVELGEIEALLVEHPAVRQAVAATVQTPSGGLRLAAYVVPAAAAPGLADELRSHLRKQLPDFMTPSFFELVDQLPLTPSGKVDRKALPAPEVQARTQAGSRYRAPCTPSETLLARIWSEVLQIDRVGIEDNFFDLGGDSIISIQIVARAAEAGLRISPRQIFEHQTVAQLAAAAVRAEKEEAPQGPARGLFPLTPVQRWFFEQELANPHHFNMPVMLQTDAALGADRLGHALQRLQRQHDALRLRFVRQGGLWRQVIQGIRHTVPLSRVDLSGIDQAKRAESLEAAAAALQAGLDLERGFLLRPVFFQRGSGRSGRLLMVVHHLLVDAVSWRILVEELNALCRQPSRPEEMHLPSGTTSFQNWARHLQERARSPEVQSEADYWLSLSSGASPALPIDHAEGTNTEASVGLETVSLSKRDTQALLRKVPSVYRTRINDALLTALAQAMCRWAKSPRLMIHLEGHGREEFSESINLSCTVGWFTSIFPAALQFEEGWEAGQALKSTKEQLRQVPNRGLGYGLLRYLGRDQDVAAKLRAAPQAQASFNYLGQLDQALNRPPLVHFAKEPVGPARSPRNRRSHLLDVVAFVSGRKLQIQWAYSRNIHRRATVRRLALDFKSALRGLIAHCLSAEAGGFTPSDFPLAGLSQRKLDQLLAGNRNLSDLYPLSPMQRDMLFHTLGVPDSQLGFVQTCWSIQGSLKPAKLKQAWQRVMQRHAILRTAFWWRGLDEPLQAVCERLELPWRFRDWRERTARRQQEGLNSLLREDRQLGFDLSQAPAFRLTLIRTSEQGWSLVWSFHHALLDGWCQARILQEVFSLYHALCRGGTVRLAAAQPYRNYIAWLLRQDIQEAESFWRKTLKGFAAPNLLWAGKILSPPPSEENFDQQNAELAEEAASALRLLARKHRLTLNTLVQGAWALLLSCCCGERDVVFGATVSGRPGDLPGVDSMIGLFINNLPVRVQTPPQAKLLLWLQQLQDGQIEMRRYEYTSQAKIRQWSEVPAGLPLYESVVVFENYPWQSPPSPGEAELGLAISRHFGTRTSSPLTLLSAPAQRLPLTLVYDRRRFDSEAASRLLRHLQGLLEAIAAAGARTRLKDLPPWKNAQQHPLPTVAAEPAAFAQAVETALREHPQVGEAAVLAPARSSSPVRLSAFVAPAKETAPAWTALRDFLAAKLPPAMLPSDFTVLDALPRSGDGQVDRQALEALQSSGEETDPKAFFRNYLFQDSLEIRLVQIWEEVFGIHPVSIRDNFFELGGNSILAVNLVSLIQERLGADLPLSSLFAGATIRELAGLLRERSDALPWSPLVPVKPSGSRPPFFCVHPVGGNVLGFNQLVRHIEGEQPFYALQSAGLDGKQPPDHRIEDMASRYVQAIREVQPHGPYRLGGISFGGFVAFEMACQLSSRNEEAALLALFDTFSPLFRQEPVFAQVCPDDPVLLARLAGEAAALYGKDFSLSDRGVQAAAPQERLEYVLERMRKEDVVPPVGLEQTERILKVHLSAVQAGRDYRPGFFPGRITIFKAQEEIAGSDFGRHPAFGTPELFEGWQALCSQPLQVLSVPGNHTTMMLEPHVRVLAKRLTDCLNQTLAESPGESGQEGESPR